MPTLLSKEAIYAMDYGNESDDAPMYTEMLEDICYGSQSHPSFNKKESCYKIRDPIKQIQSK